MCPSYVVPMHVIVANLIEFTDWCHSFPNRVSLPLPVTILFHFFVLANCFFFFLPISFLADFLYTFCAERNLQCDGIFKSGLYLTNKCIYVYMKKCYVKGFMHNWKNAQWMARHPHWSTDSYAAGVKIENASAAIIEDFNRVYWRQKRAFGIG